MTISLTPEEAAAATAAPEPIGENKVKTLTEHEAAAGITTGATGRQSFTKIDTESAAAQHNALIERAVKALERIAAALEKPAPQQAANSPRATPTAPAPVAAPKDPRCAETMRNRDLLTLRCKLDTGHAGAHDYRSGPHNG